MRADQIQARAVAKIVVVALIWAAVAVLIAIALLHTRTTLQWVAAAIFLALALDPAVSLIQRLWPGAGSVPRVLAILIVYVVAFVALVFLVLHVLPPIIHDIEGLAKKLPTYVSDVEDWAENNEQFQELNEKYGITDKLSEQAKGLPSHLSSGASTLGSFTVSLLEHLLAAITVITLTFFLLLDGAGWSSGAPVGCRRSSASAPGGSPTGSPRSSGIRPASSSSRSPPGCSPGSSSRSRASTWRCRWPRWSHSWI